MSGNKHRTPKTRRRDTPFEVRRLGVIIERVDDNVRLVAEQYGDIKKSLATHTEMITSVKTDGEIMKEDLEFIKNSLKQKVNVEEFAALERRVALLEKRTSR